MIFAGTALAIMLTIITSIDSEWATSQLSSCQVWEHVEGSHCGESRLKGTCPNYSKKSDHVVSIGKSPHNNKRIDNA
eukprot:6475614-Amphidinium_carterae.1